MKMTQAYAWLAAGVLAAGLNASYYDGGLLRVHEMVDRVEQRSAAAVTLASGHAGQFFSEMRSVTAREQTASCPLSAMARAQARLAESEFAKTQAGVNRFEAMADREQAQVERMEARRARIEAQVARIRIPAVAFSPMAFSAPKVECPRVRVNLPRLPRIRVPAAPVIHIETASVGPV